MKNTSNPLLCDPEKGFCEMPYDTANVSAEKTQAQTSLLQIIYFTDPICSSCWGIEPQLRKLKLEYGKFVHIEYRMGGLLPSWEIYNSGAISKPADVAHHWDEVSAYYDMPIDGDVWLEDPLPSSYPPSIAFKAAQMQSNEKAIEFLRRIREMVFLEKKNITKFEYLTQAAQEVNLDTSKFKTDFEGKAQDLFKEDLLLSKSLGVRGFPTLFFTNTSAEQILVYGFRPYEVFENAILKIAPQIVKNKINTDWETLFKHYPTLTSKEFSVLSNIQREKVEAILNELCAEKKIERVASKNGFLWRKIATH